MSDLTVPRAMLGAFIGDAVGAVLEFSDGLIPEERVQWALSYPGGGPHRIGKGQITDDSDLTLALWRALCSGEERPQAMMREYADWLYSVPFDVGMTCRNAFDYCLQWKDGEITQEECQQMIAMDNKRSEANGALMRATAIASYVDRFHHGDIQMGLALAEQDALLSHPSPVCVAVNQVYVYALLLLLEGVTPVEVVKILDVYIIDHVESETVRRWYVDESQDISEMNCTQQEGHVRWAFVQAMYFLRHPEIGFEEALRTILRLGGDTDTNACIVGGLVACYQEIPPHLSEPVLLFDPSQVGRGHRWRPKEYNVRGVFLQE